MAESKFSVSVDVLPMSAKITDSKLNWTNYHDWHKTVQIIKQLYKEMKAIISPTTNLQTRIQNMEHQAIISFLEALDPSFETIRYQILSSQELPSLDDVFSRVLQADSLVRAAVNPTANALDGRSANTGNHPSGLATSSSKWIIESGATDHT